MISPLITNKKRPKVKTVSGMVKITSKGLTKILSIANTIATKTEVRKLSTYTPGSILASNITKSDEMIILIKSTEKGIWVHILLKLYGLNERFFEKIHRQMKESCWIFCMEPVSNIWNGRKLCCSKLGSNGFKIML